MHLKCLIYIVTVLVWLGAVVFIWRHKSDTRLHLWSCWGAGNQICTEDLSVFIDFVWLWMTFTIWPLICQKASYNHIFSLHNKCLWFPRAVLKLDALSSCMERSFLEDRVVQDMVTGWNPSHFINRKYWASWGKWWTGYRWTPALMTLSSTASVIIDLTAA